VSIIFIILILIQQQQQQQPLIAADAGVSCTQARRHLIYITR